jgi:hypothetical protein
LDWEIDRVANCFSPDFLKKAFLSGGLEIITKIEGINLQNYQSVWTVALQLNVTVMTVGLGIIMRRGVCYTFTNSTPLFDFIVGEEQHSGITTLQMN